MAEQQNKTMTEQTNQIQQKTITEQTMRALEEELANPGARIRVNIPDSGKPKTLMDLAGQIQQKISGLKNEVHVRTQDIVTDIDYLSRELQTLTRYLVDKIDGH